mgnify:CR=1 FL=1
MLDGGDDRDDYDHHGCDDDDGDGDDDGGDREDYDHYGCHTSRNGNGNAPPPHHGLSISTANYNWM